MDVRAQVSMVFHLDKCIGCHTCSVTCKSVWTDRKGAEYMWWNNVETKPGTGYPTQWEDQHHYGGGFEVKDAGGEKVVQLRSNGRFRGLGNIFHNPKLPTIDDYYEPWTYRFDELVAGPSLDEQPMARAVSMITDEPMEIGAGPNWDGELAGSSVYAANDPNLGTLSPEERAQMAEIEKLVFFYLPRMCNHCSNPSCVAACPSSALYKRGEDGIVVVDQDRCRGWRECVSACPYKKTYFNWAAGKSEKCNLCYPMVETGQAPACFQSCVGRIRYLGVVLYDADKMLEAASAADADLVDAQRAMILDPNDPEVVREARKNGIHDTVIEAAVRSPVYKFVKQWGIALPLHPEYRTLPMLFYVPPLLPVMGNVEHDVYDATTTDFFASIDKQRMPLEYLGNLFAAGNAGKVRYALRKMMAVRYLRRSETVGDIDAKQLDTILAEAGLTRAEAEAIYRLTAVPTFDERFVVPPSHREEAIEALSDPLEFKGASGLGFTRPPQRIS